MSMKHTTRALAALPVALAFLPSMAAAHPDPEQFAPNAFTEEPVIVDCTLENGTETTCYELTVGYQPEGLEIGPFCPTTLDETGGLWDWDGEEARALSPRP